MPTWFTTRALLAALVLWLLTGAWILLQFWPRVPDGWQEVALILAFGPPAYGLLEGVGSWALSQRHGQAISSRRLSPLRLVVAFLVALAWLAIAGWFTAHMLQ